MSSTRTLTTIERTFQPNTSVESVVGLKMSLQGLFGFANSQQSIVQISAIAAPFLPFLSPRPTVSNRKGYVCPAGLFFWHSKLIFHRNHALHFFFLVHVLPAMDRATPSRGLSSTTSEPAQAPSLRKLSGCFEPLQDLSIKLGTPLASLRIDRHGKTEKMGKW